MNLNRPLNILNIISTVRTTTIAIIIFNMILNTFICLAPISIPTIRIIMIISITIMITIIIKRVFIVIVVVVIISLFILLSLSKGLPSFVFIVKILPRAAGVEIS